VALVKHQCRKQSPIPVLTGPGVEQLYDDRDQHVTTKGPFRPRASNQTNVKDRKHSHRARRCASINLHKLNERCQFKLCIGYWTFNNNKWPKCSCQFQQATHVLTLLASRPRRRARSERALSHGNSHHRNGQYGHLTQ